MIEKQFVGSAWMMHNALLNSGICAPHVLAEVRKDMCIHGVCKNGLRSVLLRFGDMSFHILAAQHAGQIIVVI